MIIYSTIALLEAFPIFQVSTPKTKKLYLYLSGYPTATLLDSQAWHI